MKWTVSSSLTSIQSAVISAVFAYLGFLGFFGGCVFLRNVVLQKLTQEHSNEKIHSDSKEAN